MGFFGKVAKAVGSVAKKLPGAQAVAKVAKHAPVAKAATGVAKSGFGQKVARTAKAGLGGRFGRGAAGVGRATGAPGVVGKLAGKLKNRPF